MNYWEQEQKFWEDCERAIEERNSTRLEELLQEQKLQNEKFKLNNYLREAVEKNDLDEVKFLIDFGLSPNIKIEKENFKKTILTIALENKNMDMANLLVENGANVNEYYEYNKKLDKTCPLMIAIESKDLEAIKFLLDNGATPSKAHSYKRNDSMFKCNTYAFEKALKVFESDLEIVKLLVEADGEVATNEENLRFAMRNKQFAIADYLIENGASENVYNEELLFIAARDGDIKVVRDLIENKGVDVNTPRTVETSQDLEELESAAITIAAWEGQLEMVELLLDYGANGRAKSHIESVSSGCFYEETTIDAPLRYAYQQNNLDVVKYLEEECIADIRNVNGFDEEIACWNKALDTLQYQYSIDFLDLLERGEGDAAREMLFRQNGESEEVYDIRDTIQIDVNVRDENREGLTPLHFAIRNNDLETARLLVEFGADTNMSAWPSDETLLIYAIAEMSGHTFDEEPKNISLDIIKFLVEECKIDVNKENDWGYNPLGESAILNNRELMDYLVEQGANIKDAYKNTNKAYETFCQKNDIHNEEDLENSCDEAKKEVMSIRNSINTLKEYAKEKGIEIEETKIEIDV